MPVHRDLLLWANNNRFSVRSISMVEFERWFHSRPLPNLLQGHIIFCLLQLVKGEWQLKNTGGNWSGKLIHVFTGWYFMWRLGLKWRHYKNVGYDWPPLKMCMPCKYEFITGCGRSVYDLPWSTRCWNLENGDPLYKMKDADNDKINTGCMITKYQPEYAHSEDADITIPRRQILTKVYVVASGSAFV